MPDLAEAPPSIQDLTKWATDHGFAVVAEEAADGFNQHVVLSDGHLDIKVTGDRGDWSIAIGTRSMKDTYHPDEWEAWVDDFPLAGDLSDLDHQARFVTERWPSAAATINRTSAVEQQLRQIGREHVERLLGPEAANSAYGSRLTKNGMRTRVRGLFKRG